MRDLRVFILGTHFSSIAYFPDFIAILQVHKLVHYLHRKQTCSVTELFNFSWTLYVRAKGNFIVLFILTIFSFKLKSIIQMIIIIIIIIIIGYI